MPDFLEGIVPQLIKLTLKQYHKSNIVSLNEVNGKLANFSFGCNDDKIIKAHTNPCKMCCG